MATSARTSPGQNRACTPTRWLAFEVGVGTWHLGLSTGAASWGPRQVRVLFFPKQWGGVHKP
jgi:hypothetical protein